MKKIRKIRILDLWLRASECGHNQCLVVPESADDGAVLRCRRCQSCDVNAALMESARQSPAVAVSTPSDSQPPRDGHRPAGWRNQAPASMTSSLRHLIQSPIKGSQLSGLKPRVPIFIISIIS